MKSTCVVFFTILVICLSCEQPGCANQDGQGVLPTSPSGPGCCGGGLVRAYVLATPAAPAGDTPLVNVNNNVNKGNNNNIG